MSLADRLSKPAPRTPHPRCGIAVLLDALTDDDKAAVQTALDGDWTSGAIATELQAEGHQVSHQTVARHRRGECSCEPR